MDNFILLLRKYDTVTGKRVKLNKEELEIQKEDLALNALEERVVDLQQKNKEFRYEIKISSQEEQKVRKVVKDFGKNFYKGDTIQEGLEIAFDKLPPNFLKNNK